MRKVVDSNYLQTEELRYYLRESSLNFAIITDYCAMEAYKAQGFTALCQSMEILAQFPNQVIILKNTSAVAGLKPASAELPDILVDWDQTRGFGTYCGHLVAAKNGNIKLQEAIMQHSGAARAQMDRILSDAPQILTGFQAISKTYTEAELREIRTQAPLSGEILDKTIKNIMWLASFLFAKFPEMNSPPTFEQLRNTFIFRKALCMHILILKWVSDGNSSKIKPNRIRNDIIDLNFVSYALFFDGLLSKDKKMNDVHIIAKSLLDQIASFE